MNNTISISGNQLRVLIVLLLPIMLLHSGCNRQRPADIPGMNESGTVTAGSESTTLEIFPYLPAVFVKEENYDTTTSLILTTADVARFDDKTEDKPYVNSIQIIDADQPWPPRWYAATPVYTDEMYQANNKQNQYRFDFMIDAKVDAGYFSFYKIISKQNKGVGQLDAPEFAGYIMLNEKMEPVDTVKSNTKRSNMYFHDLRINQQGERMVDLKKGTYLDLRDYTDNPKDSSVHCNVDYIQILDSNDKTVFNWNPLQHLNPDLFQYKETVKKKAFAATHADMIEWTRLTSAFWDYDGNILYAMKQIGIGKISRQYGHVLWQLNHSDMPLALGKDTLEWYSPHDFNMLSHDASTATYSLYSNGAEGAKPAGGVVFQRHKKTGQFKLLKYIWPKTVYLAYGQGNLDYHPNGDYAIGYGFFEKSDTSSMRNYRSVLEYKLVNGPQGVYQLPQWIYTYKARILRNWPRPPRPVIIKKGELLEAVGDMQDFTWYKLSGERLTTVQKAGTGKTLKPEKGATYCVEAKYGIGFSVSRAYKN